MENKKLTTSLVASFLFATNIYAIQMEPITITSSLNEITEEEATFSAEVYTSEDIAKSKSKDIYDFLNSQTSVIAMPNSGNPFSQKLDLRGYGLTDGYENIVVTVNGRRLNTIDLVPQFLQSVSLDSIERIEIIKGSGSVIYGDGAQAGTINIITKGKNANFIKVARGDNNTKVGTLSLGHATDKLIFNALIDYISTDGEKDDPNYNRNKNFSVSYFPTSNLELFLKRDFSNSNVVYPNSLTLKEYNNDIKKDKGGVEHYFRSYVTTAGLKYDFLRDYSFDLSYSDEDKISNYITWSSSSEYKVKELNANLTISKGNSHTVIGANLNESQRIASTNKTHKDSESAFINTTYKINKDLNLSAGIRTEKVEYKYDPKTGSGLSDNHRLSAYDVGLNYKLDDKQSIFVNYNKAYQAPNIDRFFNFGGTFNGFIEPSNAKTINVGYNNFSESNKLKVTAFRTDLKNEIYLYKDGGGFVNTNLDDTYKYGLEIFNRYNINKNLFTTLNYNYTIAKIDEDSRENGDYDGKYIPGVCKHNVVLGLGYTRKNFTSILTHTYRSDAFNAEDFKNEDSQKQESYQSTDLSLSYTYKNAEVFAKVQNIFDEKNGFWVRDDAIYPTNYYRSFLLGVKYSF